MFLIPCVKMTWVWHAAYLLWNCSECAGTKSATMHFLRQILLKCRLYWRADFNIAATLCGLFFVNLPKVCRHRAGVSGGDDAFFEAATVSRRVSTHRRCGKTCLTFSYVRYGDVFQNYAPLHTMAVFAWFCSKIMDPCYYKKVKYDSIHTPIKVKFWLEMFLKLGFI